MTQVRVNAFSISLDGYGAGPDQSLDHPLGRGGKRLHEWAFATRTFQRMFGQEGGATGVDDGFAARSFDNLGAWILGRNMFGPVRGPWPDESWRGWWGEEPPYHVPVFVLTHHERPPLEMAGRHDLPLRHRRHRGSARPRPRSRRRPRRPHRRRRRHDPPISGGAADRQAAPGRVAGAAGPRRESVRRPRPAGARLSGDGAASPAKARRMW